MNASFAIENGSPSDVVNTEYLSWSKVSNDTLGMFGEISLMLTVNLLSAAVLTICFVNFIRIKNHKIIMKNLRIIIYYVLNLKILNYSIL